MIALKDNIKAKDIAESIWFRNDFRVVFLPLGNLQYCHKCDSEGHAQSNCPTIICTVCGGNGHDAEKCSETRVLREKMRGESEYINAHPTPQEVRNRLDKELEELERKKQIKLKLDAEKRKLENERKKQENEGKKNEVVPPKNGEKEEREDNKEGEPEFTLSGLAKMDEAIQKANKEHEDERRSSEVAPTKEGDKADHSEQVKEKDQSGKDEDSDSLSDDQSDSESEKLDQVKKDLDMSDMSDMSDMETDTVEDKGITGKKRSMSGEESSKGNETGNEGERNPKKAATETPWGDQPQEEEEEDTEDQDWSSLELAVLEEIAAGEYGVNKEMVMTRFRKYDVGETFKACRFLEDKEYIRKTISGNLTVYYRTKKHAPACMMERYMGTVVNVMKGAKGFSVHDIWRRLGHTIPKSDLEVIVKLLHDKKVFIGYGGLYSWPDVKTTQDSAGAE